MSRPWGRGRREFLIRTCKKVSRKEIQWPLMTEDQVQVTTLYSPKVPINISAENLKDAFEKEFGKISTVKFMVNKHEVGAFHPCLITFEKPEDAAKAIYGHPVCIEGSWVKVFAADTWHQPNQHTSISSGAQCKEPIECTLTRKLNADCIYEILRYLTTVEICNFKVAFSYYAKVCDDILQRRLKYLDMKTSERFHCDKTLTLLTVRNVLQVAGYLVKHLKIDTFTFVNGLRCLNLVPRFCPNLEKLEILEYDLSKFVLAAPSSSGFPKLTALHLEYISSDGDAIYRIVKNIRGQIKELTLKNNKYMSGEPLELFQKLESLTVAYCNQITPMHIEKCLEKNRYTIKKIDLLNYRGPLFLQRLANIIGVKMPNLEDLRIRESYLDKHKLSFMNLTNLKSLTFEYISFHFSENEFCKIYDTLEELSIGSHQDGFADEMLKILLNFSNLKVLKLFFGYYPKGFLPKLTGKFEHLEEFHLSKCTNTNETELLDFIKSHNKLHTIHIERCKGVVKGSLLNDCQEFLEQEQDCRPKLNITVADSYLGMLRTACHSRIELELLDEDFHDSDDSDFDPDDEWLGESDLDLGSGSDMDFEHPHFNFNDLVMENILFDVDSDLEDLWL